MSTINVSNIKNPSAGSVAITLDTLGNVLAPSLVPPGTVQFYAANTAPAGWVKANGAALSRTTYADLFAAIGTTYGVGDGSTTFALPDLRGEFVRGWDDDRAVDTGRVLGSAQADELKSHTHNITSTAAVFPTNGNQAYLYGSTATPSGATGGNETRPRNIALLAIIKF